MITLILMLMCLHRTVLYLCTVLCFALSLFLYACTYACVLCSFRIGAWCTGVDNVQAAPPGMHGIYVLPDSPPAAAGHDRGIGSARLIINVKRV